MLMKMSHVIFDVYTFNKTDRHQTAAAVLFPDINRFNVLHCKSMLVQVLWLVKTTYTYSASARHCQKGATPF
jgi:hypothetical protein